MYVSTAKVLRQFAQKVASRGIRPFDMDAEERAAHEAYMASKAEKAQAEAPKLTNSTTGDSADNASAGGGYAPMILPENEYGMTHMQTKDLKSLNNRPPASTRIEMARHKGLARREQLDSRLMGALNSAVSGAKGVGGAMAEQPGTAFLGAGLGGLSLYGLARMLQSAEDRKKRRPIVAPALGALGGAALAPLLANMFDHRRAVANIGKTDQSPAVPPLGLNPTGGMNQVGPAGPTALA